MLADSASADVEDRLQNSDRQRSALSRRKSLIYVAHLLVLAAASGLLTVKYVDHREAATQLREAAALEQKYDGKIARGDDGGDTRCADGDMPPSEPVEGAPRPPVLDQFGNQIGTVQLRTSVSKKCPPVVWARVRWGDKDDGLYVIPPGLTLQVETHRPDTGTTVAEPESSHSPIGYAYSAMLVTIRGCAFVKVYFTDDNTKKVVSTPTVTMCAKPPQGVQ